MTRNIDITKCVQIAYDYYKADCVAEKLKYNRTHPDVIAYHKIIDQFNIEFGRKKFNHEKDTRVAISEIANCMLYSKNIDSIIELINSNFHTIHINNRNNKFILTERTMCSKQNDMSRFNNR